MYTSAHVVVKLVGADIVQGQSLKSLHSSVCKPSYLMSAYYKLSPTDRDTATLSIVTSAITMLVSVPDQNQPSIDWFWSGTWVGFGLGLRAWVGFSIKYVPEKV